MMLDKLRAPHLLHVLPTFVPGGLEMRAVNLIAGFGDEFRHSIFSVDGRTDAVDRLPAGAPVRILPAIVKAGSLTTAWKLRALLRSESPDLVLTYNWGAFDMLLAARSLGFRRVVHHEDGFDADEAHSFKKRRILARRAMLGGVSRLIVPSDCLHRIATSLWKVPEERITQICNGIRLDAYSPADGNPELRRELGIPENAPVIGAVGAMRPEKRLERLLDACAALDPELEAHVLVVGDGEMRPLLEERAARPELAGRVHLVGYRPDPHRFYRAMDVFAIPSDTEQMPLCLLEAMASGLPVVSTAVGDIPGVLPALQAAYLVRLEEESTTIAGLSRHLADLLRDPAARRRLGRANRARVEERFTFDRMRSAFREVYRRALGGGVQKELPRHCVKISSP